MANSSGKIILFDLPYKNDKYGCWSPNIWKSRLVLNYKSIPYNTQILKHEEIEPTLSALNVPPNPADVPGAPVVDSYTLPTIRLQDGTCVMDSANIAAKLEELYPEPSLHLENKLHDELRPILGQVMAPLTSTVFLRIKRDVLVPESVPAWSAKREARFGSTLEELDEKTGGEKAAWAKAQPGFEALQKFLVQHKQDRGPFVQGSQVSYVDFVLAGFFEGAKRMAEDFYERFCENVPEIKPLLEACKPWLEKDR